MTRKCFNCGAELPMGSIKCKECGFMPDVEFARTCPDSSFGKCKITNKLCENVGGEYQMCPIKNKAESESWY